MSWASAATGVIVPGPPDPSTRPFHRCDAAARRRAGREPSRAAATSATAAGRRAGTARSAGHNRCRRRSSRSPSRCPVPPWSTTAQVDDDESLCCGVQFADRTAERQLSLLKAGDHFGDGAVHDIIEHLGSHREDDITITGIMGGRCPATIRCRSTPWAVTVPRSWSARTGCAATPPARNPR